MASLFKRTYRRPNGKQAETRHWYVEIVMQDAGGTAVRVPGFVDKSATAELGRKLERLAGLVAAGEQPDAAMTRWLEGLPGRIRKKLADCGLLDKRRIHSAMPLSVHLDDYKRSLTDAGATADHVRLTCNRAKTILDGIGARFISGITASAVARYLAERRSKAKGDGGLSVKSSNHYLAAVKGFCLWLVRERRTAEHPLVHLTKLNAATDRKHVRRALEIVEVDRLLTATWNGPERYGMSAEQRYWLYRLGVSTGLRSNELRNLTPMSFDLDTTPATVTVDASFAKNRRTRTVPLQADMVADLGAFLGGTLPKVRLFAIRRPEYVVQMFREDLEAASIAYRDDADRVADFHSLRVTYATMLVSTGTDVKTAQEGLGHATPMMTLGVYAKVLKGTLHAAVERLPHYPIPDRQAARATGTDDRPVGGSENWQAHWQERGSKPLDSMQDNSATPQRYDADADDVDDVLERDYERIEGYDRARGARQRELTPTGFEPVLPA